VSIVKYMLTCIDVSERDRQKKRELLKRTMLNWQTNNDTDQSFQRN